jgi:hypothetical protein
MGIVGIRNVDDLRYDGATLYSSLVFFRVEGEFSDASQIYDHVFPANTECGCPAIAAVLGEK